MGKRKKLDMDKDGKLTKKDFAMLRKKKKKTNGLKTPAWQRKEGKNPSGGLNAKGRASYNRATGGNLKAPSKKGR